jgi:hypothetical protein
MPILEASATTLKIAEFEFRSLVWQLSDRFLEVEVEKLVFSSFALYVRSR